MATTPNGEVVYEDGATITITSDIITANRTGDLYAVWQEKQGSNMIIFIGAGVGGVVIITVLAVLIAKKKKGKKSKIMSKQ